MGIPSGGRSFHKQETETVFDWSTPDLQCSANFRWAIKWLIIYMYTFPDYFSL